MIDQLRAYKSAQEKRKSLQDQARSIGIDEAFISTLVDRFYERVRADAELGPVFERTLEDRWDSHLANMKRFWTSIALRVECYSGKPVEAHRRLTEAKPEHFSRWLSLFQETLQAIAPNPQVEEYFMASARSIGRRLAEAMSA